METLCILACQSFAAEIAAAVAAEHWQDVFVVDFPSTCGLSLLSWEQVVARLPRQCAAVVILGRSCLKDLPPAPDGFPPLEIHVQEQCFDLIAPPALVRDRISSDDYLMSCSWLRDWRSHLAQLAPDNCSIELLRELGIRQFTLLDTETDADATKHLGQLSAFSGLPTTRIALGLDPLRNLLARIVLQWRQRQLEDQILRSRREIQQIQAEQSTALDLLMQLAQVPEEEQLAGKIEEIFRLFFAPAKFALLRLDENGAASESAMPREIADLLRRSPRQVVLTPDGGFLVRLQNDRKLIAVVIAEELAFPEFRERYLGMAQAIADIAALALENMQTRKRLQEAERMASLGVVIAGIAHEINTPAGVCLTAISTLEGKTSALAAKFSAQTMKHSDLASYLENTASEAQLILDNLERIGRQIETFRKIAVGQYSTGTKPFNLCELIHESVHSFGSSLGDKYRVAIECESPLTINSSAADWNSVLVNLLSNSLQHGFKERDAGCIQIAARKTEGGVQLDYSDDGVGLDARIRRHIFDPFFTTDMQHGMGLGMHIVYNIVKYRLGGTIRCDETVSRGARFRIQARR